MSNELIIPQTASTPEVNFNGETGKFIISGRSLPEDIGKFFDPIASWVKDYIKSASPQTDLTLHFEYYNSSTARKLAEIIFDLEELSENGKAAKITWLYNSGDLIMKENGEEIKEIVSIPFEIQEV